MTRALAVCGGPRYDAERRHARSHAERGNEMLSSILYPHRTNSRLLLGFTRAPARGRLTVWELLQPQLLIPRQASRPVAGDRSRCRCVLS